MKTIPERIEEIRHWFIDHRDVSEELFQHIQAIYDETVSILTEGATQNTTIRPIPLYGIVKEYFESDVSPAIKTILSKDLSNFDSKNEASFEYFKIRQMILVLLIDHANIYEVK